MGEPPGRVRAVTRADVARRAGVSTAVVSYVVTGARAVRPATEAKVRDAIDELGYRPNGSARALRTGRTNTLGVVVSDVSNPYFGEYALEIEAAAADRGRSVMIASSHSNPRNEELLVGALLDRQVDGLIIASVFNAGGRSARMDSRTPVVWIDAFEGEPGFASIGTDLDGGAEVLTRHLVTEHGHRDVALVLGESNRRQIDPRQLGWQRALEDRGLERGPVLCTEWNREGGLAAGRALFARSSRPDAVVAGSDLIAIGVLRAAFEAGLRVPDDIAVVSFDGTKESAFSAPALSVVRQPIADMAFVAVALVVGEEPDVVTHTAFPSELIIRESCGRHATQ